MAKLGSLAIKSVVKIKEDGVPTNFLVLKHGYPLAGNGRTLLIRQDVYPQKMVPNGSNNRYENSRQDKFVVNTYTPLIDAEMQPYITGVNLWMNNKTVNRRFFVLAAHEVGANFGANEGEALECYKSNADRIAYLNGKASSYTTRTAHNVNGGLWFVYGNGTIGWDVPNSTYGRVRPAFTLPSDMSVDTSGNVSVQAAPSAPTYFSFPSTITSGSSFSISWSGASDADGDLQGYILERSLDGGSWTQVYKGNSARTSDYIAYNSANYVQYRVKAYDATGMESGWYTGSTKSIVNNLAPSTPSSITVPLQLKGGENTTITWAASSDSDGNLSGYQLSRQVDGGNWSQIYSGSNRTYTDTITKGWTSVAYRVRAFDSYNEYSSYATSDTRIINNNAPPVITCAQSGDLGEQKGDFRIVYSVSDADGDTVTVTEKLDGTELRTFSVALGQENVIAFEGTGYVTLLNGQHTLTITATDTEKSSATLTLTFSKAVHACEITLSENMAADDIIKKTLLSVTRLIPAGAEFKVLVTNNANDEHPVWEDATNSVLGGRNHVFENTEAENGFAYNFKITANRGESSTGGYIGLIGGAFQ